MNLFQALVAFTLAAGLLTITPGVDTLLVLRTLAAEGPRRAGFAAIGIVTGCLAWGAAVALGIAAVLAAAPMLFLALKWSGAAYLAWIGLGLLLRPRERLEAVAAEDRAVGGDPLLWYRRGLVTNLLNPKIGIFYLSFLPQFVPHGYAPVPFILLLTCLHALMGLFWLAGLIAATIPLGRMLARPAFIRRLDRTCGALFVALGARLALAR